MPLVGRCLAHSNFDTAAQQAHRQPVARQQTHQMAYRDSEHGLRSHDSERPRGVHDRSLCNRRYLRIPPDPASVAPSVPRTLVRPTVPPPIDRMHLLIRSPQS